MDVVEQRCVQGGGRGRGRREARAWAACCCECGAAAWQLDAGLELRRCGGERCGRQGQQRAVVGQRVCECCGARAGQLWLQRRCARGARGCERWGPEERDGVRGVSMVVVEQRCVQGGGRGRGRREARAWAACCCECRVSIRIEQCGFEFQLAHNFKIEFLFGSFFRAYHIAFAWRIILFFL